METHEQKSLKESKGSLQSQQHSPTSATRFSSSSSPSSPSSSPEFSFAIPVKPSSTPPPTEASVAVDLSPADDIFFHGHLLPLHLLSPFTSPPRPMSPFNHSVYPAAELDDWSTIGGSTTSSGGESTGNREKGQWTKIKGVMQRRKKFLSFFSFESLRWAKGNKSGEDRDSKEKRKRWLKLDHLRKALRRYSRMTDSLSLGESKEDIGSDPESNTFSGRSSLMNKQPSFSVPVSMMASPENYGRLRLVAKTETDRSTMEELQAAIQAAIAHCKSSMALEEKHNP